MMRRAELEYSLPLSCPNPSIRPEIMRCRLLLLLCYFLISSCITSPELIQDVDARQTRIRNAYDFEVVNCKFIRELEAYITLFDHTWPYYSEGATRRHFRSQMVHTVDFTEFWWLNFAENGVWDHLINVAETRANAEVCFFNLS